MADFEQRNDLYLSLVEQFSQHIGRNTPNDTKVSYLWKQFDEIDPNIYQVEVKLINIQGASVPIVIGIDQLQEILPTHAKRYAKQDSQVIVMSGDIFLNSSIRFKVDASGYQPKVDNLTSDLEGTDSFEFTPEVTSIEGNTYSELEENFHLIPKQLIKDAISKQVSAIISVEKIKQLTFSQSYLSISKKDVMYLEEGINVAKTIFNLFSGASAKVLTYSKSGVVKKEYTKDGRDAKEERYNEGYDRVYTIKEVQDALFLDYSIIDKEIDHLAKILRSIPTVPLKNALSKTLLYVTVNLTDVVQVLTMVSQLYEDTLRYGAEANIQELHEQALNPMVKATTEGEIISKEIVASLQSFAHASF